MERLFSKYGHIVTCKIKGKQALSVIRVCALDSQFFFFFADGYGFVVSILCASMHEMLAGAVVDYDIVEYFQEFEYERDAEDAIRALDG